MQMSIYLTWWEIPQRCHGESQESRRDQPRVLPQHFISCLQKVMTAFWFHDVSCIVTNPHWDQGPNSVTWCSMVHPYDAGCV